VGSVFNVVGDGQCIEALFPCLLIANVGPYMTVRKNGMRMEVAFQYFVSPHVRDNNVFPVHRTLVFIEIEQPVSIVSL
jgi:hypothetical protein